MLIMGKSSSEGIQKNTSTQSLLWYIVEVQRKKEVKTHLSQTIQGNTNSIS